MTSVTQVLDYLTEPELLNWYLTKGKAACKKIGDEAKRIGSMVDMMVQHDIQSKGYTLPNEDTAVINCMAAWEKFKQDNPLFVKEVRFLQMELVDGDLVGHPDILTDDMVVDIKTSRAIQPRYWTQTAQYARMAKKSKIAILRLDKESGLYEWKVFGKDVIEYENRVFDAYLVAYKHNMTIREIVRKQLEMEVLGVS